jgi:hypothetical protein
MAKKKTETEGSSEGLLVKAAKEIGAAAGKVAALAGAKAEKPRRVRVPKLVKKNKSRLPRKQKKALRKSAK